MALRDGFLPNAPPNIAKPVPGTSNSSPWNDVPSRCSKTTTADCLSPNEPSDATLGAALDRLDERGDARGVLDDELAVGEVRCALQLVRAQPDAHHVVEALHRLLDRDDLGRGSARVARARVLRTGILRCAGLGGRRVVAALRPERAEHGRRAEQDQRRRQQAPRSRRLGRRRRVGGRGIAHDLLEQRVEGLEVRIVDDGIAFEVRHRVRSCGARTRAGRP